MHAAPVPNWERVLFVADFCLPQPQIERAKTTRITDSPNLSRFFILGSAADPFGCKPNFIRRNTVVHHAVSLPLERIPVRLPV